MAPFRWPSLKNDIALAKEVASKKPQTHQEWDELATILSEVFSSDSNRVELKGRGCRERLTRLIEKNEQDDKKSLKKSGTEEEYSELSQLLQDISTYRRDMEEYKAKTAKDKEQKKKKRGKIKKMGEEIRKKKAWKGCNDDDECTSNDDDYDSESTSTSGSKKGKVTRKRATRLSAVQMLEQKNERKADLKERELKLKSEELQLQKKKFEQEAAERKERLQLELEERRMFLQILKEKM
ncbi:unnamed protein product [Pocillopora meandrina]|uniref:Uncharacterized protein n=1 Tax=Pocillopora meandrina TaxID=46732 RepID=A0AAU9WSR9_9CNID|nr:unnamed protein product [Pocillopora meandrina]